MTAASANYSVQNISIQLDLREFIYITALHYTKALTVKSVQSADSYYFQAFICLNREERDLHQGWKQRFDSSYIYIYIYGSFNGSIDCQAGVN